MSDEKPGEGSQLPEAWTIRHRLSAISPIISLIEFGLSFGCALSAWFSGDMMLVLPVLALGWLFAAIGFFSTPRLSNWAAVGWAAVIAALFAALGAFVYWHSLAANAPAHSNASATTSLDDTIGISCSPTALPEAAPPSSPIAFIEAFPPKPSNTFQLGFGGGAGRPGQTWSKDGKPLEAWHCRMTNYGSSAVFNIQMTFHEEYMVARKDGACVVGKPEQTYDHPAGIYQLGVGKQEAFHFYVWNASQMCTSISMPTKVALRRAGEENSIAIKLVPPNVTNVILGPMH